MGTFAHFLHFHQLPGHPFSGKSSLSDTELLVPLQKPTSFGLWETCKFQLLRGCGFEISVLAILDTCCTVLHFSVICCPLISGLQEPSQLILVFLSQFSLFFSGPHRSRNRKLRVYCAQLQAPNGAKDPKCRFCAVLLRHLVLDLLRTASGASLTSNRRRSQVKNRSSANGYRKQRNVQGR